MNIKNDKIIRLHYWRPYGHGSETIKDEMVDYVDYFIEDLIQEAIKQDKKDLILKALNNQLF